MNVSIDWPGGREMRPTPDGDESNGTNTSLEVLDVEGNEHEHLVPEPWELAASRQQDWPDIKPEFGHIELLAIYQRVKETGLPNMLKARVTVPTQLSVGTWDCLATGHPDDSYVSDGVRFGFPLHYTGPPIYRTNKLMHASAEQYIAHLDKYVQTESKNLAMLGPFDTSPFDAWTNMSPLMTRPKAEPNKRRIIVDLSFPRGDNVNAHVHKNILFGRYHEHRLPTVQDSVSAIEAMGYRVLLATIDIERAYRNIPVCPLDLPLLGITVRKRIYIDAAMPFGARNSSLNMQIIAQYIVRALQRRGISCQMYLDDMIIQLAQGQDAHARFAEVMSLYRALGLPIAYSKLQLPAEAIVYLGIRINVQDRSLSIPTKKLEELLQLIRWTLTQKFVSKRMAQRIAGKVNHVSRCVHAARLFMARVLLALRDAHDSGCVGVDTMRPDLHWLALFVKRYNGRSIMKPAAPAKVIKADSCLTGGGGGTDMKRCYELVYSPAFAAAHHISTLEAVNCLVAIRTLISAHDRDSTIEIQCDSASAIHALALGRARDPVLLAVCRAVWYFAATMDIRFVYTHVPGVDMTVPDALSRAHLGQDHRRKADRIIHQYNLKKVVVPKYATNYKNYL